jgi:hypothetical protein
MIENKIYYRLSQKAFNRIIGKLKHSHNFKFLDEVNKFEFVYSMAKEYIYYLDEYYRSYQLTDKRLNSIMQSLKEWFLNENDYNKHQRTYDSFCYILKELVNDEIEIMEELEEIERNKQK